MTHLTIYLPELELQALQQLAILEFRAPKMQAAVIINAELERQGLLEPVEKTTGEA